MVDHSVTFSSSALLGQPVASASSVKINYVLKNITNVNNIHVHNKKISRLNRYAVFYLLSGSLGTVSIIHE